jgi:hypothetical protein
MFLVFAAIGFVMGLKHAHPFKIPALTIMLIAASAWALITVETTNNFFLTALAGYLFEVLCFGAGWVVKKLRD